MTTQQFIDVFEAIKEIQSILENTLDLAKAISSIKQTQNKPISIDTGNQLGGLLL